MSGRLYYRLSPTKPSKGVVEIHMDTHKGGLVLNDVVHKGTSKHKKMDEKSTHFAVHVFINI